MKAIYTFYFIIVATLLSTSVATAFKGHTGTIVKVKGNAHILINESTKASGPRPRVSYQSKFYTEKKIRRGTKVRPGTIIQTSNNSSLKLIFGNGDHINIGPSTSYRFSVSEDKDKKERAVIDVYYGKVRALISKDKKNPRSGMRLKTPTAVAGVRGTDFFVSYNAGKGTELKVIRGKVAVVPQKIQPTPLTSKANEESSKTTSPPKAAAKKTPKIDIDKLLEQAIVIDSGNVVEIKKPKSKEEVDSAKSKSSQSQVVSGTTGKKLEDSSYKVEESLLVAVKPISKESLLEVQAITVQEASGDEDTATNDDEMKNLKELEKQASQALLQDIKTYTPEILESAEISEKDSSDNINTKVLSSMFKSAPAEKPKQKPSQQEIDSIGKDIYENFFNKNK